MADLTKTITNSLRCFGGAGSSRWNAYNWGSFLWGEGTVDLRTDVVKLIANSLSSDSANAGHQVQKLVAETLVAAGDLSSERLYDGSGYQHVFPDRTPEGESRSFISWTTAASSTSGWSEASAPSTSWSDA